MNYNVRKMFEMVEKILKWEWTFDQFEKEYYSFYLEVPRVDLTERDASFFSAIHEKMDWTTPKLKQGEVEIGYVDQGGYVEWLRKQYDRYQNKPEIQNFSAWDFSEKKMSEENQS